MVKIINQKKIKEWSWKSGPSYVQRVGGVKEGKQVKGREKSFKINKRKKSEWNKKEKLKIKQINYTHTHLFSLCTQS